MLLAEPVGPGDGGSAWAAFADEYHALTGSSVAIVPKVVSGAAQHPDADRYRDAGHWVAGGEYCVGAVEAVKECVAHLRDSGFSSDVRGVLWHQDESDAIAINEGHHSLSNYRSAFREMLANLRERLGRPGLPLFLFEIGRPRSGDTDGWRAVRGAQEEFAEQFEHVHVVYDGAAVFADDGRMQDDLHYMQAGYIEMGRDGARNFVAVLGD